MERPEIDEIKVTGYTDHPGVMILRMPTAIEPYVRLDYFKKIVRLILKNDPTGENTKLLTDWMEYMVKENEFRAGYFDTSEAKHFYEKSIRRRDLFRQMKEELQNVSEHCN